MDIDEVLSLLKLAFQIAILNNSKSICSLICDARIVAPELWRLNLVVLVIFENLPVGRSDPYFRVL